jgi:hypothetical protein
MRKITLYAILFLLPISVSGEVGRTFRGKSYDVENEEKVLNDSNLTILGLTLWDSSFQEAQKKIGTASIFEQGSPPRDRAEICYQDPGSILLLLSPDTRATQEPKQRIQSVIISRDKQIEEKFATCASVPTIGSLTFFGGLHLGMTREEVKKIWGNPGKATPKVMIYVIRRIQKQYFTDDISLYLEFRNNRLSFARMSRLAIP